MGAPLFRKVTVNLENGNKIEINAPKNSDDNKYIESMKVDGKSYNKNYLKHSDLVDGATINIEMSDSPNKDRGTKKDAFPYSFSNE